MQLFGWGKIHLFPMLFSWQNESVVHGSMHNLPHLTFLVFLKLVILSAGLLLLHWFSSAISLRAAFQCLQWFEFANVDLQVDSLSLISALKGTLSICSYFWLVVEECKALVQELIGVRCQATHCMARMAVSLSDTLEWGSTQFYLLDVLSAGIYYIFS